MNRQGSVPACQHIKLSWLEKFSMEFHATALHPFHVSFGICILLFLSIGLSVLESIMFFLYFPIFEFQSLNRSVKLMVVPIVCLIFVAGHLVLFEKCMCWIVRHLPIIKWEEEASRIYGRSLDNIKPVLDLNVIIQRYAWQKLLEKSPKHVREFFVMQQNRFFCEVDTTALTFEHKVTKFSPKVKDETLIKNFMGEIKSGEQWLTLFSSYYDNNSEKKQSHIVKGTRDTTSRVDVDLQQYYKADQEVFVKLNIPRTGHSLQLNRNTVYLFTDRGRVYREIRTWNVESQVEVEPSSRAHAQLLARQECSVVDFEIRTTLSNPKGFVRVDFKFRYNDFSMTINIKNLHEAFQLVEEGGALTPEEKVCVEVVEEKWLDKDGVEHSASHPQLITRGTCVCLNWTDQKVDIKTSPLSKDESTSDGDNINVSVSRSEDDANDKAFVFVD